MTMITAAARTATIAPTVALVLTGGSTECMSKGKRLCHVNWRIIEGIYHTNQLGTCCKRVNMHAIVRFAWYKAKPWKAR